LPPHVPSISPTGSAQARVVIKPRRALPLFSRHPWVFSTAVERVDGAPADGQEVVVASHDGQFIARGLFNPHSHLRVRLYSWNEETPLDREFWSRRIDEALALRRQLFPEWKRDFACRLVNSEGDHLSGLTVDRYGDWLIVQLTSLALAQRHESLLELLREKLAPRGIWLRTEKGIRSSEGLEQQDGLLWGEPPPRPLFIEENDLRYGVDLIEGQKTGFYLDQRDNRRFIARHVAGQRVLDVFCYHGGFALNCLKHGPAKEVVAVDVSDAALTLAKANAELNGLAERLRFRRQDGFKALEELAAAGEQFDAVILDPPKLARNRAGLDAALRGYYSLNRLALNVLKPGGWLLTCSCSGHVTREMFLEVLAKVAVNAGRSIQILEVRGPAADHPRSATCLETDYLKCVWCRVA
jgi:23S rRNA (cytosine1962-C5)-methyltransferase